MSNTHWTSLDDLLLSSPALADLPPALMSILAERLERLISEATREPLSALSQQIETLFGHLLRAAPLEARQAVRGAAAPDSPANSAFMLGQLNFAQLLAAQTAERRVDDGFLACLRDPAYQSYLQALAHDDCTGIELAALTGQQAETVSRKLRIMRERGLTEFRREGQYVINFLTPAARAGWESTKAAGQDEKRIPEKLAPALNALNDALPAYLKKSPTFSTASNDASLQAA